MIGPSGVGKSTLHNRLKRVDLSSKSFLTHHEAIVASAKKQRISIRHPYIFLLNMVLNTGIYREKAFGMANRQIRFLHRFGKPLSRHDFEQYRYSFRLYYKYLASEVNAFVVHRRISNYIKKIDEHEMYKQLLPVGVPIIIDEGISHYFHTFFDQIDIRSDIEKIRTDDVFCVDGLISCEQDPDIVYLQARDRKNTGVRTFTHGHLSDSELKKLVYENVDQQMRKVQFYSDIGIPILRVNTGDDFADNLLRINIFASKISEKRTPEPVASNQL